MAKSKSTTRRKTPRPKQTKRRQPNAPPAEKPEKSKYPDAALIRLCITIKAELAAYHACADVDPDGNSCHAKPIWQRHQDCAAKAVEAVAAIPATTWAGLASKAAAMQAIMDDETGFVIEDRTEAYYRSLATDAYRLAKEQVEKDWLASRQAEKAVQS